MKCKFYKPCKLKSTNNGSVCLNGGGGYCGEYRRRENDMNSFVDGLAGLIDDD